MNFYKFALLFGLIFSSQFICASTNLSEKTLVVGDFPRAFFFRLPQNQLDKGYDAWKAEFGRLDGMINKVGFDELAQLPHDKITNYMNTLAEEDSNQTLILHFNSLARDPNYLESNTYSPQHWLYLPGSKLIKDLDKKTDTLTLQAFEKGTFHDDARFQRRSELKDTVVIVALDEEGNRKWDKSEYARVEKVIGNTIKVKRGVFGSKPQDFSALSTYVAPIATMGPYGASHAKNNMMWVYNFSANAPKDKNGDNAADVLVKEFSNWFSENGKLRDFNGVAFDLPFWDISSRGFLKRISDADNDGVADGSVHDGFNTWGAGVHQFYSKLKQALGDNILLTADAQDHSNQRAVDLLNGMESEGVVKHNDAYIASSNTVNKVTYYHSFNRSEYPFNYTFYKDKSKNKRPALEKARYGFTLAQILGMSWGINNQFMEKEDGYHYGMLDEINKGDENKRNWLGVPVGDPIRIGLTLPDFLKGDGKSMASGFLKRINSDNAEIIVKQGSIILKSHSESQKKTSLKIKGVNLLLGDMLMYFKGKSLTKLTLGEGYKVNSPYFLSIFVPEKNKDINSAKQIDSYIGSEGYHLSSVYFRNAGPAISDITLEIDGSGVFEFKDFSLHNGAPLMAREFEHGVVLNNPSLNNECFDTKQLFPSSSLSYIRGKQDPLLNSGKPVIDNQVCVSGVNGVVLRKN